MDSDIRKNGDCRGNGLGHMVRIVGVRFRSAGKTYYFDPGEMALYIGDEVIVETANGPEFGVISTGIREVGEELISRPFRMVIREATREDKQKIDILRVREREALRTCREKAREHEINMKVVGAEYSFDLARLLFYFTADGRVDFRGLVKDLSAKFRVRIELRQIGVRDETRMLGGIGTCGRELCCASYLQDFQHVSIRMAKEQNLSLNPAKISGVCGRLMCCLKNEEETYEALNAMLPKLGDEAIAENGRTGKVIDIDVLRQRVKVLFEEGETKEAEIFPAGQLTFIARKKKASTRAPIEKKIITNGKNNMDLSAPSAVTEDKNFLAQGTVKKQRRRRRRSSRDRSQDKTT